MPPFCQTILKCSPFHQSGPIEFPGLLTSSSAMATLHILIAKQADIFLQHFIFPYFVLRGTTSLYRPRPCLYFRWGRMVRPGSALIGHENASQERRRNDEAALDVRGLYFGLVVVFRVRSGPEENVSVDVFVGVGSTDCCE